MRSLRSPLVAGVLAAAAWAGGPAVAQELPKPDSSATAEVNRWLADRSIPAEELPRVKPKFKAFAQYYADLVASPIVYKHSIDPYIKPGVTRPPSVDNDPQTGIFFYLERYILVPTPTSRTVTPDKADYIREFGIAFDAALKPLIEKHPERIVRINATRLLAEVCRSGATAFYPTVTALIANPNTPTEIKDYALQAAANLLAAYDVNDIRSRKHSGDNETVGQLIAAINDCILKPEMLVRVALPKDAPQQQVAQELADRDAVVNFVRRHAIRALAKVRFATFPGPNKQLLYPAFTLAQVCVSDPVLSPPPSPGECIEAVLGLCHQAPTWDGRPVKDYNTTAVVEAIVAGLRTFAGARAEPTDRSLPWRHYGALLQDALEGWKPLFDPNYEASSPPKYDPAAVPQVVTDLIGRVQTSVIGPIAKVDPKGMPDANSRVDVEGLDRYLDQLRDNPNRKPLVFTNNPKTVLYAGKK